MFVEKNYTSEASRNLLYTNCLPCIFLSGEAANQYKGSFQNTKTFLLQMDKKSAVKLVVGVGCRR